MSLRAFVPIVTVAAGLVAWSVRSPAQPLAPEPLHQPAKSELKIQGVGGCAAAPCHNVPKPLGTAGTEYATWVADPHGRAFATLESPLYKNILTRLKDTAYTAELCLKCHATPEPDNTPLPHEYLADGIGCESCHGASEKWRTEHYKDAWRGLNPDQKEAYGFFPTKDLGRRIDKCAECHVGNKDKDVNHDLIAAGHPRLTFEYTAYHDLLKPRHWQEPHEQSPPAANARSDWESYAWSVGQAATAKAAVELTAARAKSTDRATHPWPEFTEYGCFACHQDLQPGDSWRRGRKYEDLPVGSLPWGAWPLSGIELLAQIEPSRPAPETRPLVRLMAERYPSPSHVEIETRKLADALRGWPVPPSQTPEQIRDALRRLATDADKPQTISDWESATQRYLAIAALYHALGDLNPAAVTPARSRAIGALRQPLRYPDGYNGPHGFQPDYFRRPLGELRPLFGD